MRFYYCILPHHCGIVKTLAGLRLGFFHFCGLALSHNKLVVYAFFLHKFSVSAELCKSALVKDDKPVGVAEGGKSVSNGNCRPALCELAQSVLYLLFRLSVKRSRRLVKYYYLRVMEYRSCNGNSLTFAARKLIALVAHSGVVAVRELCDKVMCIRNFRCPYYFLKGSVRLCICYIFKYVSVKKESFLQHHAHL